MRNLFATYYDFYADNYLIAFIFVLSQMRTSNLYCQFPPVSRSLNLTLPDYNKLLAELSKIFVIPFLIV